MPAGLVVLSGLPGVGKSTAARALAREMRALHLRIDTIEIALARSVLAIEPAEDAGYLAAQAVAADALACGVTVIADCVNPIALSRAAWVAVAERVGARCLVVELVCSDRKEHRRRVERRRAGSGRGPEWDDVLARHYEAWDRERLVVDTAGMPVPAIVARIRTALEAQAGAARA